MWVLVALSRAGHAKGLLSKPFKAVAEAIDHSWHFPSLIPHAQLPPLPHSHKFIPSAHPYCHFLGSGPCQGFPEIWHGLPMVFLHLDFPFSNLSSMWMHQSSFHLQTQPYQFTLPKIGGFFYSLMVFWTYHLWYGSHYRQQWFSNFSVNQNSYNTHWWAASPDFRVSRSGRGSETMYLQ